MVGLVCESGVLRLRDANQNVTEWVGKLKRDKPTRSRRVKYKRVVKIRMGKFGIRFALLRE